MTAQPLQSGFRDSVREAQAVFRSVMMAMARPGTVERLAADLAPPSPLTAELAAVALALCDHEASLWLDADLAQSVAVVDFLRFHTGTRIVDEPSTAAFALIRNARTMPPLSAFARGTDEYPDRSTTVIAAVGHIFPAAGLILEGPGIKGSALIAIDPLPADFVRERALNHGLFPRGVDCIFVATGLVAALPRTTRLSEG